MKKTFLAAGSLMILALAASCSGKEEKQDAQATPDEATETKTVKVESDSFAPTTKKAETFGIVAILCAAVSSIFPPPLKARLMTSALSIRDRIAVGDIPVREAQPP